MHKESVITLKPRSACDFDIVSLGEVMLRLDPGEGRIRTARQFTAWEGGGEYNVSRGLSRCFEKRAAVITALADNEIGRLIENFILAGGVDTSYIAWLPYDGIGKQIRNGLNFTERGFGLRGAVGVSDRGHTAVSKMTLEDVNLEELFEKRGVRWLHTGGIFASLSTETALLAEQVMAAAKASGTVISYDLNYRPSLWQAQGGQHQAQEINNRLAQYVDVMIGNEEDFTACLDLKVEGVDENLTTLPVDSFKRMIVTAAERYPNFKAIATTLRTVRTATRNDWSAIAWSKTQGFAQATDRPDLEILDRVGGGDSFASGLIYGLMDFDDINSAVEFGAAHGALAMTTPGDTSMATLAEVKRLVAGSSARVRR
ncbi:MAG: sugar kinase [Propionibacteriaceae bacterium]|jgi:2-dehydro-3-deoxygluconokinase|nr:sugar kinase [Propionibacteriaceae bacterium]